jgi:hypothetical protein
MGFKKPVANVLSYKNSHKSPTTSNKKKKKRFFIGHKFLSRVC